MKLFSANLDSLRDLYHNQLRMLLSTESPDEAVEKVRRDLSNKVKVAGFGHRVYKVLDPRAIHLKIEARPLLLLTRAESRRRAAATLPRREFLLPGESSRSRHEWCAPASTRSGAWFARECGRRVVAGPSPGKSRRSLAATAGCPPANAP